MILLRKGDCIMKKLQRILVAIDVFANPDNVLKRAFMLAKENNAELYIVQAIEVPLFSVPDYFSPKKVTVNIKGIKDEIERKIKSLDITSNVPYYLFVKEGNPDDIILYESKLIKAEMIIIGAYSKSKSKKNRFGTTAQKVAHQSHVPVLIVKNKVKKTYENIVAPTDFAMQSKQSILFGQNICTTAKISLVNAHESFYATGIYTAGAYTLENIDIEMYDKAAKTASQNNMKVLKKELGIKKGKVIDGELNVKEALHKYIDKGNYDLVILGSRGTSGAMAMLGSIAYTLLREVSTDILVYVP